MLFFVKIFLKFGVLKVLRNHRLVWWFGIMFSRKKTTISCIYFLKQILFGQIRIESMHSFLRAYFDGFQQQAFNLIKTDQIFGF